MSVSQADAVDRSDSLTRSSGHMSSTSVSCGVGDSYGCLVKAKAQVMTRDDGTGLWRPLSGGGMSVVELNEIPEDGDTSPDVVESPSGLVMTPSRFRIEGRKVQSKDVILSCCVTKELQYMSATPTFHHWQTKTDRYGLAFQSASEATEFKKVVCRTVKTMIGESVRITEPAELDHKSPEISSCVVDQDQLRNISIVPSVAKTEEISNQGSADAAIDSFSETAVPCNPSLSDVCGASGAPPPQASSESPPETISMSTLTEVLPAVPPRRTTRLPDEPSQILHHKSLLDHSVPVAGSRLPAKNRHLHSFHVAAKMSDGMDVTFVERQSDSPPVPPRPDITRSESARPAIINMAVNRQRMALNSAMPSVVHWKAGALTTSTLPSSTPASCLIPQAPPLSSQSVPGTNYVYFTEGNVIPPPPVEDIKSAKSKHSWNEGIGNPSGNLREQGCRLAEAPFTVVGRGGISLDDDPRSGDAYVRLASPQAHDYCYPSLEMMMPSSANTQPHSQLSSSYHRNTVSPPPLPTKSRLGWRDCRKRRKQAQQQQQQMHHRRLTLAPRYSYGTGGTVDRRRGRPVAVSTAASSMHQSFENDLEESTASRNRSSLLLCLLPCTGRPCPQRRRRGGSLGSISDDVRTRESVA